MSVNPLILKEVSGIAKESIRAFSDYLKCKETEKTERARIRAIMDTITKKIEADKEVFITYMEKSFEERENLYQRADKVLNKAIEEGDSEMAKIALNFMATVYHKNPLDGLNQSQDYLSSGIKSYLP